jgi:hypothetical protein
MAGSISRLTLIESDGMTGGDGFTLFLYWVVVSEQVSTANHAHPLTLPIRFAAISSSGGRNAGSPSRLAFPETGARARRG